MQESRRLIVTGAAVGVALTAPLVALLYLGSQITSLPMVAFDLFEGLTRITLLRGLVTKGIDLMVGIFSRVPGASTDQLSKAFEQGSAVLLFLVLGAIVGIIYARTYAQIGGRNGGMTVGVIAGVIALAIEIIFKPGTTSQLLPMVIWFAVLFIAWGYALAWVIDRLTVVQMPNTTDSGRRRFLLQLSGGAIALTVVAWGLGSLLGRRDTSNFVPSVAEQPTPGAGTGTEEATSAATEQAGNFSIVPGTRSEITANEDFYRVDVNLAVPEIDQQSWTLTVGGLVNKPATLNYNDVTSLPATKQFATLECISNEVGGDLISTTQWTGLKLSDLLKQVGLKDGVVEIKFSCEDGYTESLPLESAMDERTLLVYHMNDKPIPAEHGFPLRVYTPNRYGMKNPKWVVKIEAIGQPFDGYWELGGWDKQAIVKSTSVIDAIAVDKAENGIVPVGGIAFAGARQISKVEVAVDGGAWQEADLKPPLSPLTWVLWRFNWKADKGHHNLVVRTTDGQGQLQIQAEAPLHPDGASGYVSMSADV